MRKVPSKRNLSKLSPSQFQKPYRFCCEEKDQDPKKRYDMRKPPFVSSLTDVILDGGGPGVKFRVQDIGQPPYTVIQRRILEVRGLAYLGHCKRCRGPLRWYLEDEIALAREIFAKRRQNNYNTNVKRNLMIIKRKGNILNFQNKKFNFFFCLIFSCNIFNSMP